MSFWNNIKFSFLKGSGKDSDLEIVSFCDEHKTSFVNSKNLTLVYEKAEYSTDRQAKNQIRANPQMKNEVVKN